MSTAIEKKRSFPLQVIRAICLLSLLSGLLGWGGGRRRFWSSTLLALLLGSWLYERNRDMW